MTVLESHPRIALEKHLLDVTERITEFCEEMRPHKELCEVARLAALTHDLGKATGYFQEHLRGHRVKPWLSSHALLSAIISVWHVASDLPMRWKLPLFIAVRSHHANPTKLDNMIYPKHEWKNLKKQAESIDIEKFNTLLNTIGLKVEFTESLLPSFDKFKTEFSWPTETERGVSSYFTTNLLLGMLVDADIRAVIEMDANEERVNIPPDIVDLYINNLPKNSPIDPIRQEFYKTVISNIQRFGLENKFFSLTAPTGIGKTLAGFSAAVRLRNKVQKETGRIPRIVYVLPFTSIIDQNFDVLGEVIKNAGLSEKMLLKHHFRANPTESDPRLKVEDVWKALEEDRLFKEQNAENFLKRYEQAHTRVETWDGEVIVTTFVRFYETLFTKRRSEMRRLHRLAGSIVILDEVQNIPPEYWEITEEALKFLAEQWDTRFILMTATRPALFREVPELTEPHKHVFFNKLSRTDLYIESDPMPYSEIDRWLLPKVKSAESFMVVMNTVRSAQEVYHLLKQELTDFEPYFLSASLIPVHREKRIREIKEKLKGHKVALVATQVVEAGVDLDFDVVIRDLAPFDSIVQAAGRCNRNSRNKRGGKVYLVKLIDPEREGIYLASYIYDGVLIETSKEIFQEANTLPEKEYMKLVEEYFKKLRDEERKAQDKNLFEEVNYMKYDEIGSFSLLKKMYKQVPVFVEFDGDAKKLVKELEELEKMSGKAYKDRMNRRRKFQSIAPELWGYVVNVPLKVAAEAGLVPLPYASSFLWLPEDHPEFNEIYRKDTGFARRIEHEVLFV